MFGLRFPVSSACPSLLSQLSGSPHAPRPAGGERFLAAAVSCRPHGVQCPLGHLVLLCHALRQLLGQGVSLIRLQDIARAMTWVVVWALEGTAVASRALGLFFGNLFSCQKGRAQPCLFVLPVSSLPRGRGALPARRRGFVALVPCGVLLEDVLKKAVAGRELLTPKRLLVSVPWWRLQQGCASPSSLSSDLLTHVLLLS